MEQYNVYLMIFLSKQPPCQRPRLEQSLALGQREDKGKTEKAAREARMVPREWLDSKVRRLIKSHHDSHHPIQICKVPTSMALGEVKIVLSG